MNCPHQTDEYSRFENGAFRYTLSPISVILDRMGIYMAGGKLLYESLLFLFYFEALAYMLIVLEFNWCI
jgi:hypothetical protein